MMRFTFLIFFAIGTTAIFAQNTQKLVRSGNSDYKEAHYKQAEIKYRKALTKAPNSEKAAYNLGNALYKENNFDEAATEYGKLSERNLKEATPSHVFYNLGNAFLKQQKYEDAINAYKKALRENPKNEDARYNLTYALSKMRAQQNKNNQQQQQQQQQQEQEKPKQEKPKENISKDDAERMLNAIKINEKRTLEKTKKQNPNSRPPQPEKDW